MFGQGMLIEVDEVRHPMWTKPEARDLTSYEYALRRKIHSAVQPLDGRPNATRPIQFCQEVWDFTGRGMGFLALVGEIAWLKAKHVRGLTHAKVIVAHKRDADIISRLGDEFITHMDQQVRP